MLRLDFLKEERIDPTYAHPSYTNITRYSDNIKGDTPHLGTESFLVVMGRVAQESYYILEERRICAAMMGGIKEKGQMIPLGFRTMECFTECRSQLGETILREQHNCKPAEVWERGNSKFLLLAHEYTSIFET